MKIKFFLILFFAIIVPKLNAQIDLSELIEPAKTISMDLQEANLKDVMKIFSQQSGLNFIASEAVKDRKITLYLVNVPIKDTMIKLFKANKLIYEYDKKANIFIVMSAGNIDEPDLITKVFTLKHRSVASSKLEKEKAGLFIGSKIISGELAGGESVSSVPESGSSISEVVKQLLSENGKVIEDGSTNSLVVTDFASRFPAIEKVIISLDQPIAQVMLEVEMLNVSKNLLDKFGFNLGDIATAPNPLSTILSANGKSDIFIGDLTKRGSSLLATGIKGNMVIGDYYASMLSFLSQQEDTKYLARPRILTLNNETAEIGITTDEIMNAEVTRSQVTEGTVVTTTYATTFTRATAIPMTVQGIGIYLRVTPQINLDSGEIVLVVNPKTSSAGLKTLVGTDGSFYRDPEVRSTKSIIKVKDGETVVLGGMIYHEKTETRQKMPILGEIPFLGVMFRNKNNSDVERELVVFITPRIIRDSVVKLGQKEEISNSYSFVQALLSEFEIGRRQKINDLLSTFERNRSIDASRKIF